MQNGEPNVYAAIVTMRNTYLQMQWQRIQIIIAFNVVAFPIALNPVLTADIQALISWIGVAIHVLMLVANQRSNRWLRFFEMKLATLERFSNTSTTEQSLRVEIFNDPEFSEIRDSRTAVKRLFGYLAILIMFVWASIYANLLLP